MPKASKQQGVNSYNEFLGAEKAYNNRRLNNPVRITSKIANRILFLGSKKIKNGKKI